MTPSWFIRPLRRGDSGWDVLTVQHRLRVEPTGVYDHATDAKVNGLRRIYQLPGEGLDERLAQRIGE